MTEPDAKPLPVGDAEAFLAAMDAVNGPRPARPQLHPDRCRERATRELEEPR